MAEVIFNDFQMFQPDVFFSVRGRGWDACPVSTTGTERKCWHGGQCGTGKARIESVQC